MDEFLIARNPDPESVLPFLVRLPLGSAGMVFRAKDVWPRTSAVYCHPGDVWPDEPDIVEAVGVRSCVRRGNAIDLVLDRVRENRSMFVFTTARGRDVIFWQSARTTKQARPKVNLPTARAAGQIMEIVVDSHERYAWKFSHQQATTSKRALTAGDYAVEADGVVLAVVERKSLADFVSTLTGGKLRYLLSALAGEPRAALVIEDRYSEVFKLERVRPSVVADGIAEAQVRFPSVPIVFAENRALAQEWTYRFSVQRLLPTPKVNRLNSPAFSKSIADRKLYDDLISYCGSSFKGAYCRTRAKGIYADVVQGGRPKQKKKVLK